MVQPGVYTQANIMAYISHHDKNVCRQDNDQTDRLILVFSYSLKQEVAGSTLGSDSSLLHRHYLALLLTQVVLETFCTQNGQNSKICGHSECSILMYLH